jgi:hypothetical protein
MPLPENFVRTVCRFLDVGCTGRKNTFLKDAEHRIGISYPWSLAGVGVVLKVSENRSFATQGIPRARIA